MMLVIRKNLINFIAILVLIAIAAVVSIFILHNQRLRFPFFEEEQFVVNAEFATGQAVTAGQGQTVRVSGVKVGDIGDVDLVDGRAVIQMRLDPEFKDLIHTDARALLRPKTGLKDMFIELNPGSDEAPLVKEKGTLPISATAPDVNPDEFLSVLDADTRDYLKLLISDAGRGLKGRGTDLRDLFRRFEPTHRDLAEVNSAVATRRKNLRRLIHNLNVLNDELADHRGELTTLVRSSSTVLRSFASEDDAISEAVRRLPGTLSQTTDTLGRVENFANVLKPAAETLRPAARELDAANKAIIPLANEATPQLRKSIRPFVRASRPVVRDLSGTAGKLADATPSLEGVFKQLNLVLNMVAFNPNGKEGPENANRQEGYLFWLAWLNHMGINVHTLSTPHEILRPLSLGSTCNSIDQITKGRPELEFLYGLTSVIVSACQGGGGTK
jgi:phospholipid/cholesterol/gamma-HCH transport system substrate-binding protein